MNYLKENELDFENVNQILGIMGAIFHIIESILSQEELPDFYEEKLPQISEMLAFVLETNFPKFQRVPDQLIKCRSKVIRVVHLYSFKFGEEFKGYMNFFFEKIWGLICNNHVQACK